MRGFQFISTISQTTDLKLPTRATNLSAGYDFYLQDSLTILPKQSAVIKTYVKAYMQDDEVLQLYIRSSLGMKIGLRLLNQVGIIDADYYNNEDNEGHILIGIENTTNDTVELVKGERIVQGIFMKYLTVSNDEPLEKNRRGGIGSTQ